MIIVVIIINIEIRISLINIIISIINIFISNKLICLNYSYISLIVNSLRDIRRRVKNVKPTNLFCLKLKGLPHVSWA